VRVVCVADAADLYSIVLRLRCVECGRRWDDPSDPWRVYLTDDDPPESATYCPGCAHQEFDD
jgi:ribosomal protein L44E